MNARVQGRGAPSGPGDQARPPQPHERRIGFRDATIGFVLMTALVVVAATGVFILLDPRAQVFWGTKLSELVALVRGFLP